MRSSRGVCVEKIELLEQELEQIQVEQSKEQIQQFHKYYKHLVEKNKVMNLTAITEWEDVVIKHFIDSLMLCKVVDTKKDYSILDMGTGAGFPGIPLKIAFPNFNITLVDSLNKRIKFLEEVIDELQLTKIEAIHSRAEDLQRIGAYRECFDYCVSRAVANLSTLSEYCLPYVKVGGYFISYKSGNITEELKASEKALKLLGGKVERIEEFVLPGSDIKRSLVVIKKCLNTPKKYPRNAGKPSKEPL